MQYLKKEVCDEIVFLHADKHEGLLQIDTMILIGIVKHYQSSQNSTFTMSLQYIKKEVRKGVHFLHADEHQRFYKLGLLFLMEVARYVQSTQNRKLVIFLQRVLRLLLCSIVMQNIQIFNGGPASLLLHVSSHSQTRNFLPEHLNLIKQQLCGEGFPFLLPLLQADVFQ